MTICRDGKKMDFPCETCKVSFSSTDELTDHLKKVGIVLNSFRSKAQKENHSDGQVLKLLKVCIFCEDSLTEQNMMAHACFHSLANQKSCEFCDMETSAIDHSCQFIVAENLKKGIINAIGKDSFFCPFCKQNFTTQTVISHILTECGSSLQCVLCERVFDSERNLEDHTKNIFCSVIRFCPNCSTFPKTEECDCVPLSKRKDMRVYCTICKESLNRFKLREHICFHISSREQQIALMPDEKDPFYATCQYCGKPIPASFLDRHLLFSHPARGLAVLCDHCGYEFANVTAYNRHKKSHHRGIGFEDTASYRQNQRSKKQLRSFLCHLCGQQKRVKNQRDHLDAHANIKRYKCEQCDKTFSFRNALGKHRLVHNDVKKWKCEYCSKAFKTKDGCNVHMRTHAAVKPFECYICEKTFTTKQWRDSHMTTHKAEMPNSKRVVLTAKSRTPQEYMSAE